MILRQKYVPIERKAFPAERLLLTCVMVIIASLLRACICGDIEAKRKAQRRV